MKTLILTLIFMVTTLPAHALKPCKIEGIRIPSSDKLHLIVQCLDMEVTEDGYLRVIGEPVFEDVDLTEEQPLFTMRGMDNQSEERNPMVSRCGDRSIHTRQRLWKCM
jgi:hypothetical protein